MKLTEPDTKIKCNYVNAKTFYEYLIEVINNNEMYFKPLHIGKMHTEVYKYNLCTLCEKVSKLMFKYVWSHSQKFTLSINHAERITLLFIVNHYPLPLDINFIEYQIKNGLLK